VGYWLLRYPTSPGQAMASFPLGRKKKQEEGRGEQRRTKELSPGLLPKQN
jgi:hypothetical protein